MTEYEIALHGFLSGFISPERQQRFEQVLSQRITTLSLLLVDISQSRNASAILLSCEAFGVQNVTVVEHEKNWTPNRDIARGSDRWLSIDRFSGSDGIDSAIHSLKQRGFRIISMVPASEGTLPLTSLPTDDKLTLAFGTEKSGLPSEVIEQSDETVHLPMFGFVESFNVSVAAALAMQLLTSKIRSTCDNWALSEFDKQGLRLQWTKQSIPNVEALERRFLESWGSAEDAFEDS